MKILVANKFWYERGGLERVMFDEIRALESAGHEVAHFSTAHPLNIESPYSSYFAPYIELGHGSELSGADKSLAVVRMFRNRVAARALARLLDDFEPDVIHIHGIHRQISPSILFVAKARSIPVVQTVHDCHHVCPADVLLRPDGAVCQPALCSRFDYTPCLKYRCVRRSLPQSALSAAETLYQRLTRAYERTVDTFIAPSHYVEGVMRAGGWELPISVLPNGVRIPPTVPESTGSYFLVAGRLSREKGVDVAARAAATAGVELVVAGAGPLEEALRRDYPNVRFTGHVDSAVVFDLIVGCRAVVVPSVVPENSPMSVLEAMAHGRPVIASDIGGVPEMVSDGIEGLLVPPADIDALARGMSRLSQDHDAVQALGLRARARASSQYSYEQHLKGLLGVYEAVTANRRVGQRQQTTRD